MKTASMIDAGAVARQLLDDVEVSYGYHSDAPTRVTLPDGRVAALMVRYDEDSGIGEWIGRDGKRESHDDDVFGTFAWRGKDSCYGYPAERPAGFDGRARVFTGYGRGCERLDGSVWWQPPADVSAEHLPALDETIRRYFAGDWFHVGLVVIIFENGEEVGSGALWGVEWGVDDPLHDSYLLETLTDLLEEAGIGKASSAAVAPWARPMLEAIARRLSGEDPDDGPADAYHDELRTIVAWWRGVVEAEGDWDTFGESFTDAIENRYRGE
jgi:hypothetical protein